MYYSNLAAAVGMWMGIGLGDAAVGCPPGVAYSVVAEGAWRNDCQKVLELSCGFDDFEAFRRIDADSCRVIASVFKSLKPFQKDF